MQLKLFSRWRSGKGSERRQQQEQIHKILYKNARYWDPPRKEGNLAQQASTRAKRREDEETGGKSWAWDPPGNSARFRTTIISLMNFWGVCVMSLSHYCWVFVLFTVSLMIIKINKTYAVCRLVALWSYLKTDDLSSFQSGEVVAFEHKNFSTLSFASRRCIW